MTYDTSLTSPRTLAPVTECPLITEGDPVLGWEANSGLGRCSGPPRAGNPGLPFYLGPLESHSRCVLRVVRDVPRVPLES